MSLQLALYRGGCCESRHCEPSYRGYPQSNHIHVSGNRYTYNCQEIHKGRGVENRGLAKRRRRRWGIEKAEASCFRNVRVYILGIAATPL
jgi:hypothetical protein